MQVTVNGTPMTLPEGYTITRLLDQLAVKGRFAIEVNEAIMARSQYEHYVLQSGDQIEVVHAIGGG
jgi:sulfur carrier protein